jgi:hypothetical protein
VTYKNEEFIITTTTTTITIIIVVVVVFQGLDLLACSYSEYYFLKLTNVLHNW